jgi:hypothetical protein
MSRKKKSHQWNGSHHAQFTYAGITSTFLTRGGKFCINTDEPDGTLPDYENTYAFGIKLLPRQDFAPLALYSSTTLPLVVAITEIGVQMGRMRPHKATALVGAGILSVLLFPLPAMTLRQRV